MALEALLSQCMAMRRARAQRRLAQTSSDMTTQMAHAAQLWAEVDDSCQFLEHILETLEGSVGIALRMVRRPHEPLDELLPRLVGMHSLLPPRRTSDAAATLDGDDTTDVTAANTVNALDRNWLQALAGRGYMSVAASSSQQFHRALRRHASEHEETDQNDDDTDATAGPSTSSARSRPY